VASVTDEANKDDKKNLLETVGGISRTNVGAESGKNRYGPSDSQQDEVGCGVKREESRKNKGQDRSASYPARNPG